MPEGTVALSKRKVDEQAGYENILKAKEEGTVLEGVVQHVVNKGVTLTVQGVRVFIPASLTGLPRGAELEQLLKQKVEFIVIEVTEGRKRAVGSIKAVQNAKKAEAQAKFWETAKVGDVFTGKVSHSQASALSLISAELTVWFTFLNFHGRGSSTRARS